MSGTNDNNDVLYLHITPNGKKYFGVTSQKPERRWANGHGYKNQPYFWSAIQKYGWNNITHVILADGLTPDEADMFEQYFISLYDTTNQSKGYNQDLGGRGENKRMSEETKQKLSKAMKGRTHSEEAKQKMRENNSHHMKGKTLSEERKQKLSEALKGKVGKDCHTSKTVICLTTKEVFYGAAEAERKTGTKRCAISRVCNGKAKSAGKLPDGTKLRWRFVKDLPKPKVSEETKQLLSNGPKLLKSA